MFFKFWKYQTLHLMFEKKTGFLQGCLHMTVTCSSFSLGSSVTVSSKIAGCLLWQVVYSSLQTAQCIWRWLSLITGDGEVFDALLMSWKYCPPLMFVTYLDDHSHVLYIFFITCEKGALYVLKNVHYLWPVTVPWFPVTPLKVYLQSCRMHFV